ncbi:hypothetical protein [Nonomuraea sp. NPDC001831]|uniref:hypothetical protein n=1 Tax=Nonomuraea sp. NPDC001831 TaxID=3364340 RepID=UPI0036881786
MEKHAMQVPRQFWLSGRPDVVASPSCTFGSFGAVGLRSLDRLVGQSTAGFQDLKPGAAALNHQPARLARSTVLPQSQGG